MATTIRGWQFSRGSTWGISEASERVQNAIEDEVTSADLAASSLRSQAMSKLLKIVQDCSTDGWDGYSAKAIGEEACSRTQTFLALLPVWMRAPDIVPEPDGQIAVEWYLDATHTFSVSIGEEGPLHYAGVFGDEDEDHGVKAFDGCRIPKEIGDLIDKVFRVSNARRAA
ncbi:MAG: hypothetical protein HC869_05660 [Rhodospirillales bacterium]|nr:hypothetical protein [Rhodospirillales bacterium]